MAEAQASQLDPLLQRPCKSIPSTQEFPEVFASPVHALRTRQSVRRLTSRTPSQWIASEQHVLGLSGP